MYDLHSHILPGLDDGAKTLEEAVQMIGIAAQDGTQAILATPHSKDVQEASAHELVQERLEELCREARRQGIDIDIALGMENHLTPGLPDLVEKGEGYPINGHHYILVELPFTIYPDYADDVLFQLQLKGYFPLIAHPERQESIQRDPTIMERLVERGIMGQITSTSILGKFGPVAMRCARTLLKRNLVHVIASDAHRPTGPRTPVMSKAVKEAAKIAGREKAEAMVESTPKAILEGHPMEVEEPVPVLKKRGLKFWARE
ncbi:MAG: tyrosine-protein phosphatase [Dehalococcoidia bacterium]